MEMNPTQRGAALWESGLLQARVQPGKIRL
jgi:hypothetical protein